MPFVLIALGLFGLIIAVRGTGAQARALLLSEFTGPRNFFSWLFAIGSVGAIGYIRPLQPLSRAFLALIVVVIFLANQGFFQQFERQALNRAPRTSAPNPTGVPNTQPPSQPLAPSSSAQTGSGLGSSNWWAGGLPAPNMTQSPCPPGTTQTQVPGWATGVFRCIPN